MRFCWNPGLVDHPSTIGQTPAGLLRMNWTVRVWKPLRDKLGVTEPPYGLRHSYASLRIREGASITELAEELGHSRR